MSRRTQSDYLNISPLLITPNHKKMSLCKHWPLHWRHNHSGGLFHNAVKYLSCVVSDMSRVCVDNTAPLRVKWSLKLNVGARSHVCS